MRSRTTGLISWIEVLYMFSYPGSLLMRGMKIEPGIKRSHMHQILHTFRVNCNLQGTCPVYVASGTSETNA